MESGGDGEYFLRQLSVGGGGGGGGEGWGYSSLYSSNKESRRWRKGGGGGGGGGGGECCNNNNNNNQHYNAVAKAAATTGKMKRVMVVIDQTTRAKQAMMWALTHVTNKGDLLTLLHVLTPTGQHRRDDSPDLANSLGALCKACKPEVEVEALVIQGPKLPTVLSQVKKLEASVLVLSQSKPSPLCCLFRSSSEEFVEQCINNANCLTVAVNKQSKGVGGYLISTRWQKNFWLLA